MTPTITTTLGALVQAQAALAPVSALKLSAKAAYHITKLGALVAAETAHFQAARDGYITDLGTAREGGGFELQPDAANWPAFVEKVTELAAVPVTIGWGPITLAMFGDEKVSAQELAALGPLLADLEADA